MEYVLVAPETVAVATDPVDVPYADVPRPSADGDDDDESCAIVKEDNVDKASTACAKPDRAISCGFSWLRASK